MKAVESYRTADGKIHEDKYRAQRHAEARYDEQMTALRRALTDHMKSAKEAGAAMVWIEQNFAAIATASNLRMDMEIENPEREDWAMAQAIDASIPNKTAFRADMVELAKQLIPTIHADYRIEGQDDDTPTMQVTVGCECPSDDSMPWSYQTGDTSCMGGAYLYAYWGIAYLTPDTKPEDFADEVISSLEENDEFNFGEG